MSTRQKLMLMMAMLLVAATSQAVIVNVDVQPSGTTYVGLAAAPDAAVNTLWNAMDGTAAATDLTASDGTATTIDVTLSNHSGGGDFGFGTNVLTKDGVYVDMATANFAISGLDANRNYDIYLYTIFHNDINWGDTTYTIGAISEIATSTSLAPTATDGTGWTQGDQYVKITAISNGSGEIAGTYIYASNRYGCISGIQIASLPPAAIVIAESGDSTDSTESSSAASPDDSFDVELGFVPDANVVITVTGTSTSGSDPYVSPVELTFTPSNWDTPQTVEVQAMTDGLYEGFHINTITLDPNSTDANFASAPDKLVTVNVTDVDAVVEWRFIIVGDSRGGDNGVNTAILSEIAAEIVAQDAEFVLFPGDLVNGSGDQATLQSQLTTWRDTMQPVYDAGIGVYPVRGNHDAGNLAAWQNVFSVDYALPTNGPAGEVGLTYSVSHKNVFVLALDQYRTPHRVNQSWVDAQLAANANPHIFAMGHEPAFKVSHAGCLDDYPVERDAFWESLKNAGCKVYACGHDHFYDHAVVDDGDGDPNNDISQCVVGTAGAPIYSFSPPYNGNNTSYTVEQYHYAAKYGYLLVEVSDSVAKRTWFERNNETGVYEQPIASADFDGSLVVDLNDLSLFVDKWLYTDCIIGNDFCDDTDMDQSTKVDIEDYALFAEQWQDSGVVVAVSTGNDDAEENVSTGSINLTSSDLELTHDGSTNQIIGIRLNDIPVERGVEIADAYIQFTVDETANLNPCSLMIYVEDTDNAPAFTSTAYNISSRTKTAGISWVPQDWTTVGLAGPEQRTPNLASIINQVIGRAGWVKGNSIVLIIDGSGRRTAESFNGAAAPKLHLQP